MKHGERKERLKILEIDPWLEPHERDLDVRMERYWVEGENFGKGKKFPILQMDIIIMDFIKLNRDGSIGSGHRMQKVYTCWVI